MAVAEIEPTTDTGHSRPPAPEAGAATRERLISLDVFRGATVAGMLLVNNPGTWSAIYGPLGHAEWHGWTPTDLVFPFFLFIVGVTTHLSLSARTARGDDEIAVRRQILRRGATTSTLGKFRVTSLASASTASGSCRPSGSRSRTSCSASMSSQPMPTRTRVPGSTAKNRATGAGRRGNVRARAQQ